MSYLNETFRLTYSQYGVPQYSEKFKDVLYRFYMRKQSKQESKQFQFYKVRLLGLGAFSMVYIVQEQETQSMYAQKIIKKNKCENIQHLCSQIKIHLTLSHQNIVNLYHCYSDENSVYLIMELGEDSLFTLKNKGYEFVQEQICQIMRQLCSGVYYLHQRGLVHGDLKLENIIMTNNQIKICDFGHTHKEYHNFTGEPLGTLQYLSPEYVQGKDSGKKRDIWALGIICYELLTGTHPLDSFTQQQKWIKLLEFQKQNIFNIERIQTADVLKNLLKKTICDVTTRATCGQLLQFFPQKQQND